MPAPAFPQLPSGNNPSLGAAADAGQSAISAYSAGLQFATALRAAAEQQRQHAQQERKQQLKDELDAAVKHHDADMKMRDKYTPYDNSLPEGADGRPTLMSARDGSSPTAPPVRGNPNDVVTDPWGGKWTPKPDKPEATPQQVFADETTLRKDGGAPLDAGGNAPQMQNVPRFRADAQGHLTDTGMFGIDGPPPQESVRTPPGGTRSFYMPSSDELAAVKQRQDARGEAAKPGTPQINTKDFTSPVAIDPKKGTATPITLPAGVTPNEKPEKEPRKETLDDWVRIATDPATSPEDKKRANAAIDLHVKTARSGTAAVSDDPKAIADAIERGDQPPTLTGLYRQGPAVRAELARRKYNLTTATMDWQATQKHLSTLNGPQQERLRQAITFTSDSLDNIEHLYSEWQKYGAASGIKIFNRASLATAKNLPGKAGQAAQMLEAQINDLTSELGTVYKGGNSSTDESLRLAAGNLSGDWSPETFKRGVGQIRMNLKIRRNSIMNSEASGVSPNSPYAPHTQQPTPQTPPQNDGANSSGYIQGRTYGGMTYLGGDPNTESSWKKK